jgi:hypothetical protein
MKKMFFLLFFSIILLGSCDLFGNKQDTITMYIKSFFLGESFFELNGKLYDAEDKPLTSGNEIVAKLSRTSEWKIQGSIEGNNFFFNITRDTENISLSKDTMQNTAGDIFRDYYFHAGEPPGWETKVEQMDIYLDGVLLKDMAEGFFPYFVYVYISEPLYLSGTFPDLKPAGENIYEHDWTKPWKYECDFSKAGWYKVCRYYNEPIQENQTNSTGVNTKYKKL